AADVMAQAVRRPGPASGGGTFGNAMAWANTSCSACAGANFGVDMPHDQVSLVMDRSWSRIGGCLVIRVTSRQSWVGSAASRRWTRASASARSWNVRSLFRLGSSVLPCLARTRQLRQWRLDQQGPDHFAEAALNQTVSPQPASPVPLSKKRFGDVYWK